jgi:uncharacterized SAM-binding protein YcdF (DUF218 family)
MPSSQADTLWGSVLSSKRGWIEITVIALVGWLLAWGVARLLIVQAPIPHADAIFVLSGSSRLAERNHLAAQLFKESRAPRVILTNDNQRAGWERKEQRNPFFYEWAQRILEKDGVPADRIEVVMEPVSGTYEEVKLVRDYMDQHNLRSVLVVTSAYHSRRTWWTVKRVFEGSNTQIGLVVASPTISPGSWWLHFGGWKMIIGEYVKLFYYCLRFR